MASIAPDAQPARRIPLIAPTEEAWRAMTPAQRDRLLVAVNEALSDPLDMMSEGRPHSVAKGRAIDVLSLHFRSTGRTVYLAAELAVLYPGQQTFSPDVIAITGVPQPDDDRREAWVVVEEGRGIDLALEVLHHGDRKKDLEVNVERYARAQIPEYFVYDVRRQQIHGYRLPAPGAGRYEHIVPQAGRFHSEVLDLDLMIVGGKLQFFYGAAALIGSDDLIGRLEGMVSDLGARADLAEADAEKAQADAEKAQADAEKAQADAEKARAVVRDAILALLEARGISLTPAARAWLEACDELPELQRRLLLATTAGSLEELLGLTWPIPGNRPRIALSGSGVNRLLPDVTSAMGFSLTLHAGILVVAALVTPSLGESPATSFAPGTESYRFLATLNEPLAAPPEEDESTTAADADDTPDDRERTLSRCGEARGGSMGKPTAAATELRYGVQGPADNPDSHLARSVTDSPRARWDGLIGPPYPSEWDPPDAPSTSWARDDALGTDSQSAAGNMWGVAIGAAFGSPGAGIGRLRLCPTCGASGSGTRLALTGASGGAVGTERASDLDER